MTIYKTPSFQIAYCDVDTALVDLAEVTRQVAATVDAALTRGGIAPDTQQALTLLPGRTTALEGRATALEGRATALEADSGIVSAAPYLGTGWSTSGGTPLTLRKRSGLVFIRGVVSRTNGTTTTSPLTLPAGYRPDVTLSIIAQAGGTTAAELSFAPTGVVTVATNVNTNAAAMWIVGSWPAT